MMTLPRLAPVTDKEHEPEESVHAAGLSVAVPVPDSEKVSVPLGDTPPDTVAVQDEVVPTANDVKAQETERVVVPGDVEVVIPGDVEVVTPGDVEVVVPGDVEVVIEAVEMVEAIDDVVDLVVVEVVGVVVDKM
jgi:hypothetical protein